MRSRLAAYVRILARFALGATIVLIPFRYRWDLLARPLPPVYKDYTDLLLFASDVFLAATLVLWALSLALEPRRLSAGPFFLTLPVAGLAGLGLASVAFSADPTLSLYHAMRLILLAGLYLYVLNEIKSLTQIVLPVAIQVFIQAAVGIAQVIQQRSLGLKVLDELELDPAWNGISIVWADGIRSLRAYGLSDHPNILGGCLAFGLLLIAAWYVNSSETRFLGRNPSGLNPSGEALVSHSSWRAPAVGLFALGGLGLLLAFSRSAWVALTVGWLVMVALFLKTRQNNALRDLLALLAAGLILVAPFAWQNAGYLGMRFNLGASFSQGAPENRSIAERVVLNRAVNTLFAEHALQGVGLGALPVAMRHRFPDFPINYQPAHSVLLDAAAELGIGGALLYAISLLGPWLALGLNRRRLALSPALIGITGLLVAVTVVGLFDYYTWLLAPGRLWQWLVWGLWAVVYQSSLAPRTAHQAAHGERPSGNLELFLKGRADGNVATKETRDA